MDATSKTQDGTSTMNAVERHSALLVAPSPRSMLLPREYQAPSSLRQLLIPTRGALHTSVRQPCRLQQDELNTCIYTKHRLDI